MNPQQFTARVIDRRFGAPGFRIPAASWNLLNGASPSRAFPTMGATARSYIKPTRMPLAVLALAAVLGDFGQAMSLLGKVEMRWGCAPTRKRMGERELR